MEGNHKPAAAFAPALLIRIELEAPPRLAVVCATEGDELRLRDWLGSHPDLLELADRALELACAAEVA